MRGADLTERLIIIPSRRRFICARRTFVRRLRRRDAILPVATMPDEFFDLFRSRSTAISVVGAITLTLGAPVLLAQHLAVRNYSVKDGLVRSSIRAIHQDAGGWMWFATSDGLDRYDGAAFTHFTTADGLPSDFINDIIADSTGALWIATNFAGISRYHDRRFTNFLPSPESPPAASNRVNKLLIDSRSRLWVATDAGVLFFHDSRFVALDTEVQALTLAEDSSKTVWVGTTGGLMRVVQTGTLWHLERVLEKIEVQALACDRTGLLWVGTTSGLLLSPTITTKQPWQKEGLMRYLQKQPIRALLVDPDNTLWIGLDDRGVVRFTRDGMLTVLDETNGLAGSGVRALYRDREGNLWFGTTTGLSKLINEHLVTYTRAYGLPDYAATAASRDETGAMWFGTRFGVARLDNEKMRTFTTRDGLASNYILTVFTDAAGTLWCGTEAGPSKFQPQRQRFRSYGPREGWAERNHKPNRVRAIYQDDEGNLWFGSDEGVSLYRHDKFLSYPIEGEYGARLVAGIVRDAAGDLWVGLHSKGVLRFEVSARERHGTPTLQLKQRIGVADGLKDEQIRCAWRTRDGQLWFGTRFGGAIRIVLQDRRIASIRSYTTADGLASNWVNGIVEDRKGDVWLATSRGANRLTFSSPDAAIPEVRTLTVFDGLAGEGVNAVYEDVNGFLWFATYNGVTRYEPAEDMPPSVPPSVYITRVVVSGQEDTAALRTMQKKLPYQHQSIAFDFVGLSFRDEARVQYRYTLEGFDSTWSAMTDRRYVHYTHLPPGEYRFKVAARNGDGVWSAAPATFRFTVDAPLWAQGWFVVSAAMVVATLLWLVHRYRLQQALAFERVRLRIAADLHDDVGSTLSSIAIASEVARKEMATNGSRASEVLTRINANARAMLERLDDIVWAINPANDSLDEILLRMKTFVADAMEHRGIAYTATFPENTNGMTIPMEKRGHLYLIFKEAVNNIARHSGCTEAEIRLELRAQTVALTVRDNGRGFDPNARSTGDGLRNMHRRAAALGAQLSIASAPGKGTTVHLITPFT